MTDIFVCILGVYAFFLLIQALRWIWLIWGIPDLRTDRFRKDVSLPTVSIIVPARNEEQHIEACLNSLVSQRYRNKEIIVVDDESTDETAEIVRGFDQGIILVQSPQLPEGWIGKSWACHNGTLYAKGDWFLFTDADAVHKPGGLLVAVSEVVNSKIDMLTVWPLMKMQSFWERLILPIVFRYFFIDFGGHRVNDPASRTWAGFGMFILIRRDTYWAIGGHAAIREHPDEDYRLAEQVKKKGFSLRVVRGHEIAQTRMYENLATMWEGWVKNSFAGFDYNLWACLREMVKLAVASVIPSFLAFLMFGLLLSGEPFQESISVLCLLLYPIVVFREVVIRWQMGYSRWPALLTFVGEVLFICMNLHSAIRTLAGRGITWKSRTYLGKPKS